MPIANCIVTSACKSDPGNLIELWAGESGHSPAHMTVNIVTSTQQFGQACPAMATLWLPSIWTKSDISSLQLGLARALEKYFNLAPNQVHIITQIVIPGMVVEDGQEIQW